MPKNMQRSWKTRYQESHTSPHWTTGRPSIGWETNPECCCPEIPFFFKLHHLYGQKVRVDFFSGEVWSTHMLKNIWKQSGDNEDRMIQLYHDRINRTNIQDDHCWSRPCPRPLQVSPHKDISSVSTRQNPKLRVTYQLTTCQGIS